MSKRKRIKAEEKISIAQACIRGTISINAAAEKLGVHQSVVDDRVRQYEAEGVQAFLPRAGNRRYDPALKETAVKDYLSGRGSLREICRIYKIQYSGILCKPIAGTIFYAEEYSVFDGIGV